ncbi:MAG TPA: SUMF1/EgtB/PvdO family nonheme iron enzyme [Armatimonadota bacterium]|nr:SUMF1/EgtB/PvdO family nonheme iron enzyme [Armatimonadota bacterium]
MKKLLLVLFVASVLFVLSVASSANVFNLGQGLTNLETVTVGDPGNQGELSGISAGGYGPDRICGAVDYIYNIGKYEVTAGQYCDFLNHVAASDAYGLYNASMWSDYGGCKIQRSGSPGSYTYSVASDRANRPVNYVSFWDSCRFANWLHNGQPAGPQNASTTEDGVYLINGYSNIVGWWIERKAHWMWAVTREDEWYKAAYYKGGMSNAYWDYPTQSNTVPGRDLADASGNNANYYTSGHLIGSPYYRTEVGEFHNSYSYYGTFDQAGNIAEWNESIVHQEYNCDYRGLRGGSYGTYSIELCADCRYHYSWPSTEERYSGFRVVQAVPEPSSLMILAGGIGMLLGIRRRNG